ncbi:MAG TPA: YggT family protein [Chloroflexia bacterium]|nr:YggT family protein [Chloroflexia bacterium]
MAVVFQIAMILLDIVTWAVIARAILSWFYPIGKDPWSKLLLDVTEPLLAPVRTVLSRIMPIPIDFSPIVVILLINLLQRLLISAYHAG